MNSFILCVRDKASGEDKFGIGIGPISYLKVSGDSATPLPSHKVGGVRQWLDEIVKQANPSEDEPASKLDIVFFIHGYNTDPEEALKRQRLVEVRLRERNFHCMVIGFDWPTAGSAALYSYDRFAAQNTASLLVKGGIIPFASYTLPNCPINIHVMAHSMGGFVVREAFRAVDKGRNADLSNDWRIGQLVLFGADISSECFEIDHSDMVPVFDHCGRITNYYSGHDEALAVSNIKNIDINSRVGRVGMPINTPSNEKAVDVDCGPRYAFIPDREFTVIDGMVSHSWYLEDTIWYDDLAHTLKGQLDRKSIPSRNQIGNNDFILNLES